MKKIILICLLVLTTTGCWNYRELNDYAIATGMAIDYKDDKYEVTLLFSNGKKEEDKTSTQITVATDTGKTIYEAIKNISLSVPKEIYLSHLSVVIISDTLAKEGITPTLDFLLRDPQSHQNFYFIVSKDKDAKDILSVITPLSDYPSQNVTSSIKLTEKLQGRITNAGFNNFVSSLLKKGINPVSNSIILVGDEESGTKKEEQENSKASAYTKLDTLGIFKGDKLVDWANTEESIGINMLLDDVEILYLDIPCEDKNIVLSSNSYKLKNDVKKDKISVDITVEGKVNEVGCSINLKNEKTIENLEDEAEKIMKEYTEDAINKAKELKTDIFGYGNMIYDKFPKYFNSIEDWDEKFTDLPIDVNVKYIIDNTGSLQQTIGDLSK